MLAENYFPRPRPAAAAPAAKKARTGDLNSQFPAHEEERVHVSRPRRVVSAIDVLDGLRPDLKDVWHHKLFDYLAGSVEHWRRQLEPSLAALQGEITLNMEFEDEDEEEEARDRKESAVV